MSGPYHHFPATEQRLRKRRLNGKFVGTRCIYCGMVGRYHEINDHGNTWHWCFQMEVRINVGESLAGFGGTL